MTFKLDTSGRVAGALSDGLAVWYEFDDLTPFAQGYVEAMFASLSAQLREQSDLAARHAKQTPVGDIRGFCEDSVWSRRFAEQAAGLAFSDLAPETLAAILEDCERFRGRTASKCSKVGALFWKNRSAGYLSDDGWTPLTPTLGEDGKVYLRESL